MILMIDNYDSFTFNLVQYLGDFGAQLQVFRNDAITLDQIEKLKPAYIVLSPGPGRPEKAGIMISLLRRFAGRVPILGVCLGHQAICHAFGGQIVQAKILMHGKTSAITHDRKGLFAGLPTPLTATRYHSLIAQTNTISKEFVITAKTERGEVMGVRHKRLPCLEGVQFHPESILTEYGKDMLKNFIGMKIKKAYQS